MLVGLNNSGLAKRSINDKEFSKVAKIRVKKCVRKMGGHAWNSGENNISLFHRKRMIKSIYCCRSKNKAK